MFELLDRDGFGRVGRVTTPHGSVRTPVLLPVIHPEPAFQVIAPAEMASEMGVEAVITSSYILRGREALRDRALAEGLHRFLGFPGTVMTDSGAFQQHVYGEVSVSPSEILEFEKSIGSDILTPLDVFVEPHATREEAARGVEETLLRVAEARRALPSQLLAVPVQGGLFPELRSRSLAGSIPHADILCIGGIVPLMESYRFADLVRVLAGVRANLPPEKPVHLFGMGHPMLFALGALLGGDIFDTSSYHKFARRGALLFPEGTIPLESVKEDFCGCSLCAEVPLLKAGALPEDERVRLLSRHNLHQCLLEIARVRQAIREGELWELVERRSTAHPAMRAAVAELVRHRAEFLGVEPPSRTSFLVTSEYSLQRPALLRFERKLSIYRERRSPGRPSEIKELSKQHLESRHEGTGFDPHSSESWEVETPLGPVPFELSEIYPMGSLVVPQEFAALLVRPPGEPRSADHSRREEPPDVGHSRGETPETTSPTVNPLFLCHALGILEWAFGREARDSLARKDLGVRHSRSSGRLREILVAGEVAFIVANDGLPHPTLLGGRILLQATTPPGLRVVASKDAVPFLREGKSLFSRHVVRADPNISPDQYVLIVDESDRFQAVGRAKLAGTEMGRFQRGVAVRVTAHEPKST